MADPVSNTGTAAGLLSLGIQATQSLVEFYNPYKSRNYRSRNSSLAGMVNRIESLLDIFQYLERTLLDRNILAKEEKLIKSIETSIKNCDEPIYELQEECQKFPITSANEINAAVRSLPHLVQYFFRRSTLQNVDETIREIQDNLSSAVAFLLLEDDRRTQDSIAEGEKSANRTPAIAVSPIDQQKYEKAFSQSLSIAEIDSGYASMGKSTGVGENKTDEDNMTIYTDNEYVKLSLQSTEAFIAVFTQEIHEALGEILHKKPEAARRIAKALLKNLRDFSILLRHAASSTIEKDSSIFVRRHRRRIANTLEGTIQSMRQDINLSIPPDGLSVAEKMKMWNVQDAGISEVPGEKPDDMVPLEALEGDVEEKDYPLFSEAYTFVTKSNAFRWLLGKVQTAVTLTRREETVMDEMTELILANPISPRAKIRRLFPQTQYILGFISEWSPLDFLKEQYCDNGEDITLGKVITLNGSAVDAQAVTCSQYMHQMWPSTGDETMRGLEAAISREQSHTSKCVYFDGTEAQITIKDSSVHVRAFGAECLLAEIGEQFAWLGAACRASPNYDKLSYCTARIIRVHEMVNFTFLICFSHDEIEEVSTSMHTGTCWHSMFRNPVIAKGYPIPVRDFEEKGLEISLNMMAGLSEASRATKFDGGILIKGFSTGFVPTRTTQNSIVWHFLDNKDRNRLSYSSARELCPEDIAIKDIDNLGLTNTRNFVGWTTSALTMLGSEDVDYKKIGWTGSNLSSPGCAFDGVTILVGKYIVGGATFRKGIKDTPIHLKRSGPYAQEIHFARSIHVVLYDTKDRRGWLVDGASALLHLTRSQLSSPGYCENVKLSDFHHADLQGGADAAVATLIDLSNRRLVISEEIETWEEITIEGEIEKHETKKQMKNWCFEDLVRQTWGILEQIHDHQSRLLASPGIGLRGTDREKLEGFGFMDIVCGENPLRPRVTTLKPSGRGWVDFIRSVRAITLLGRGFGELIRPTEEVSNQLCRSWKSVPKDQDYLTASISTLEKICEKYGDSEANPLELVQGIYWHKADKLFEACDCKSGKKSIKCDRVQVLLPPSLGFKRHPHPFETQQGAVIFGRSEKFSWHWPNFGRPEKTLPEQDVEDDLQDSGLGTSINTMSLVESSHGNGSNIVEPSSSTAPIEIDSKRHRHKAGVTRNAWEKVRNRISHPISSRNKDKVEDEPMPSA